MDKPINYTPAKQLRFAREYRMKSIKDVCDSVKDTTINDVERFESGFIDSLSENQINNIMKYLNFPKSFLQKRIGNISVTNICLSDKK